MPVVPGVIQESILCPTLLTLFFDYLLRKLPVPSYTFADDLQIVLNVNDNNLELNQSTVLNIEERSIENKIPLTNEKCCALHRDKNNSDQKYFLFEHYINSCDMMLNLGVIIMRLLSEEDDLLGPSCMPSLQEIQQFLFYLYSICEANNYV